MNKIKFILISTNMWVFIQTLVGCLCGWKCGKTVRKSKYYYYFKKNHSNGNNIEIFIYRSLFTFNRNKIIFCPITMQHKKYLICKLRLYYTFPCCMHMYVYTFEPTMKVINEFIYTNLCIFVIITCVGAAYVCMWVKVQIICRKLCMR